MQESYRVIVGKVRLCRGDNAIKLAWLGTGLIPIKIVILGMDHGLLLGLPHYSGLGNWEHIDITWSIGGS